MTQRIRDAETFAQRDKLLRDLAAHCYDMAKAWAKKGDEDPVGMDEASGKIPELSSKASGARRN